MNKLLFLVLLLSPAIPVIYAATPDVIVKKVNFHYNLNDFSILVKEGTVEVQPAPFSSAFPEGGEPAIPVFRTRLEVPSCSFCHIDTIQSANWVMVAENVQLLEEVYPLIGSSKNLPVRKVYETHEPIVPMQQVRIATLNNHPDNGFIFLETSPFIYDTSSHSLYFTPDITVVISILVSDEWKRQKGIHVEILTIDALGSLDYPEELPKSIKSWLYQNRQERGLAYALIGGDVNIVPAVNCYAPVKTGVISDAESALSEHPAYAVFPGLKGSVVI